MPSTFTELCSRYAVCNFQVMWRSLATFCTMLEMNVRPLSLTIVRGKPYLGMIAFMRARVTFWLFWIQVGQTSTHLENVQMKMKRNLYPQLGLISLKSTFTSSNGCLPECCTLVFIPGSPATLLLAHVTHCIATEV